MAVDRHQEVSSHVLGLYSSLAFTPPPGQFTVLASLVLASTTTLKVISIATGSKCLPAARLPDSHAEILARRAAIHWFFEEIDRSIAGEGSQWIEMGDDRRYCLKSGVRIHMYISTPPCTENLPSSYDHGSRFFQRR
jgi:tRNA-specific adenosine deaminase 1